MKHIFQVFEARIIFVDEIDGDDVDAQPAARVELLEPTTELAQFALFGGVDHFLRQTKQTTALGFHLDQHNRLLIFG